MNAKELLYKCDKCSLKECIACEFTWTDLMKIREYVEEKDQIIDELLNVTLMNEYCPYEAFVGEEPEEWDKVKKLCDCNNCQKEYKECWIKYFKNEILERKQK